MDPTLGAERCGVYGVSSADSSKGLKGVLGIGSFAHGLKSRMDTAKPEGSFQHAAKMCETAERKGKRLQGEPTH